MTEAFLSSPVTDGDRKDNRIHKPWEGDHRDSGYLIVGKVRSPLRFQFPCLSKGNATSCTGGEPRKALWAQTVILTVLIWCSGNTFNLESVVRIDQGRYGERRSQTLFSWHTKIYFFLSHRKVMPYPYRSSSTLEVTVSKVTLVVFPG